MMKQNKSGKNIKYISINDRFVCCLFSIKFACVT